MAGYDLRDETWIPVRMAGGDSQRVGLRELFRRAHEIEDIELPVPPAAAGLMRILAAMTSGIARADEIPLGCLDAVEDGLDAWLDTRDDVLARGKFDPAAVDHYFDRSELSGRFDLFDPGRPFLQDPRLRAECMMPSGEPNTSGVNKLVMGRPTGVNGAVLFGHFFDFDPVPVPAHEAAWHLIAQLYFGPSGQCTPRKHRSTSAGNGTAGPVRKSLSFFPWGPDLFTSLVLAVPAPEEVAEAEDNDVPPWEGELTDPTGPAPPPSWPSQLLTGRFRHAVLLVPNEDGRAVVDCYVTWGVREPPLPADEPYLVLERRRDDSFHPREADGERALWRDVDALLLKPTDRGVRRPPVFNHLPDELRPKLRVRAYGFDQDGQQKDSSWFQATTPPVLRWQEEVAPAMALHIAACREAAETVGQRLDWAAKEAWKVATDPPDGMWDKVKLDPKKPGPWASAAASRYWPAAEKVFWRLTAPERLDVRPLKDFVDVALSALNDTIGPANRADVRVARALSRARSRVRGLLKQAA